MKVKNVRNMLKSLKANKDLIPIFWYGEYDLNLTLNNKDCKESRFDFNLKQEWTRVEGNGILRYTVNKFPQVRRLDGDYQFMLQLNTERSINRRMPEEISSINQPVDPARFNFLKVDNREIFFGINDENGNDVLLANVSPINWLHSLFVPQRNKLLPQKVTHYSLTKVIDIFLLSKSIDFRILFNSLCANASVNHLHWHLYFLKSRMLLETVALLPFVEPVYTLEDYPAPAYCVKLILSETKDINRLVSSTYTVVKALQENEIAHNVFITRGKSNPNEDLFDEIRIYIWARASSYGIKNTEQFNIAACELFGHFPIFSKEAYFSIDEEYLAKSLREITQETFKSSKDKVRKALLKKA